jgi:hypothetical protein
MDFHTMIPNVKKTGHAMTKVLNVRALVYHQHERRLILYVNLLISLEYSLTDLFWFQRSKDLFSNQDFMHLSPFLLLT